MSRFRKLALVAFGCNRMSVLLYFGDGRVRLKGVTLADEDAVGYVMSHFKRGL